MERNINIRLIELNIPNEINRAVILNEKTLGEAYIVALNKQKNDLEKAAAFLHKALHIYHQDLSNSERVSALETDRKLELLEILQYLINEEY